MCGEFIRECLNLQIKKQKTAASLQSIYIRDKESPTRLALRTKRNRKRRAFPGTCAEGEVPRVYAGPVRRRSEGRKLGGGAKPGPGSGRGRGCWLRR